MQQPDDDLDCKGVTTGRATHKRCFLFTLIVTDILAQRQEERDGLLILKAIEFVGRVLAQVRRTDLWLDLCGQQNP